MTCGLRSLRWAHIALAIYVLIIGLLLFAVPAHAGTAPVFDAPSITVSENAGTASFVINKSAKATSYSKIRVQTVDGSAKAGIDYRAVDTTLTIGSNTLRSTVPITILDNAVYQGSRMFAVRLTITRNGQLVGSYVPPTVTITDDEGSPPPTQACPDGSVILASQICPSPLPQPPLPSTGLGGEAAIADNFDTATGLQPTDYGGLPPVSADPNGSFRILCFAGQILKDDPIVYPGQPGASPHLHQFWGNTGANGNSTYQSLRTSGQSTCQNAAAGPVNRTAYWMPAMLDGAGNVVKPDLIQTYYKNFPASNLACAASGACVPLPNSLRFIFGQDMKTMSGGITDSNSTFYWMNRFECWSDQQGTMAIPGFFHTIDEMVAAGCPAGAKLIISFVAPNCWDGKNVDTLNHRDHVVWATRWLTDFGYVCPLSNPYLIPNFGGHVNYTTDANFAAGKWLLDSDRQMAAQMGLPRVPAGSTLHFDYFEAWSPIVKARWDMGCIQAHKSCNRGDLGDGSMVKLWTTMPEHVLVPVP